MKTKRVLQMVVLLLLVLLAIASMSEAREKHQFITLPTMLGNDALAGVTLAWFTATGGDGQVLVEWETASEIHLVGFNLWRNTSETGDYARLNDSLIPSKAIGSVTGAYYSYTDKDVINGTAYYYKLESVAADGVSEFHGPVSATAGVQPTSTPTPTQTATHTATPTTTPPATPYRLYLPIIVKNYSGSLSVGYGSEIRQACGHNVQINVAPSLPTQDDNVQVIASGDWYDTCIPFYHSHQIDNHVIRVDAVIDYPVGTGCADMITPWEFMVDIGKLPTGVYEVNLYITDLFNQVPTALCATKSFTVFTEVTYLPIVAK